MVYEALVIDNSEFYSKGKIRVRIPQFYNRKMIWDLTENFPDFKQDSQTEDEDYGNDFEAMVYSPYGGGKNFGVFFLPQVNQKGIVILIGQSERRLLWLGSFFEPTFKDENFPELEYVNIPSDLPESTHGSVEGEHNMDAEDVEEALGKNFVARFKTTKRGNSDQEDVDWEARPTSNIITIGDKNAKVTHFSEEDGWDEDTPQKWQEFSIEKNEDDEDEIKTIVHNEKDSKISKTILKENTFNVEIDNNGEISKFYVANDDEGISFYFEDSYGNMVTLNKDEGIKIQTEKDLTTTIEGDTTIEATGSLTAKAGGDVVVESSENANIKAGGDVVVETGGTVKINGASDTAVLYSQLKKIIEALEGHIHIAPTGPTASPLNSDMSPITAKTMQSKMDMESKSLELE